MIWRENCNIVLNQEESGGKGPIKYNLSPSKAHNSKTVSFTDRGPASLDRAFKNTALLKKLDRGHPCSGTFKKSASRN